MESGDSPNVVQPADGLQDQITALQDQLARLQLASNSRPATQVLYVPRERKIRSFSGKDGELTVQEFVEDIESLFRAREMSNDEKCDLIVSHLEGDARHEIRYWPKEDARTPRRVLEILLEVFGEKRSVSQLQELFYLRKQLEGESIRSFAAALQGLLETLTRKDSRSVNDPDRVLAEHFAEGLKDRVLRREVKQQLRLRPDMAFVELREEAIMWSEEEERPPAVRRHVAGNRELAATSTNTTESASHSALSTNEINTEATNSTIQKVLSTLEDQTRVLGALSERVRKMEEAANSTSKGRQSAAAQRSRQAQRSLQFTEDGRAICYKCGKVGHLGRQCCGVTHSGQPWRQPQTRPPRGRPNMDTCSRNFRSDDPQSEDSLN